MIVIGDRDIQKFALNTSFNSENLYYIAMGIRGEYCYQEWLWRFSTRFSIHIYGSDIRLW